MQTLVHRLVYWSAQAQLIILLKATKTLRKGKIAL